MASVRRIMIVAALAIFMVGCSATRNRGEAATARHLKALIDSKIPTGSTDSQVTDFLDKNGFQYSNEIQSHGAIFAAAPLSPRFELVKRRFQVTFHFDQSGRLRDYTLTKSFIGP